MRIAQFPLGQIVATPGALQALEEAGESPAALLKRHVTGDWGELDEHDRLENERSLADDCRLLSAYILSTGVKLWIISFGARQN
jgi:hypothetical protein